MDRQIEQALMMVVVFGSIIIAYLILLRDQIFKK